MNSNRKEKYKSSFPEPISLKGTETIIEQMNNSICRIYNNVKGNGFFTKIPYNSKLLPVLITTNNIINQDDIQNNKIISLFINNDKKIKTIKLDNNRLMYTNEKLNVTIIEIIENKDNLKNKYLELDNDIINYLNLNRINLIKKESPNYLNESIYVMNYSNKKDIFVSFGKLLHIKKEEIVYKSNIKEDSFGSPILLTNNQKLIGIHNGNYKQYKDYKGSLLIYSLIEFSKIKNKSIIIEKEGKKIYNNEMLINNIICELNIKEDEQEIRIINSYEQSFRERRFIKYNKKNENEKEIKENCEIRINGKLIPFSYFYYFDKKGIYTIIYNFKNYLTKTNYLFSECSSFTNINLSYFNTENIINMSKMFNNCTSLNNINLSNINTKNVTNMSYMFYECQSLVKINLSNFNTKNVTNMSYMFSGCSLLSEINLSNFNTNNVNNMGVMFSRCSSLININLSNFNTNKVTNMSYMFNSCSSLVYIDLSNFSTKNVIDMSNMFNKCSSLNELNLSNFIINDDTDMTHMFHKCEKLTKEKINTYDIKILNELEY